MASPRQCNPPADSLDGRGRVAGCPVHVAGTGSYSAEISDYARAAGFEVVGLIELADPERVGERIHDLPVVAAAQRPDALPLGVIGAGGDRLRFAAKLAAHGWSFPTLVHPAAHVSPTARLAPGCVVAPGAIVGAHTVLDEHALVGRGGLIGHHVHVGAGATVNPGANVGGNSRIGAGAQLGMGAVVVNGIEIGRDAVVAAGAVVVRAVAARTRVQGVPARPYERRPT
jgi:sugar O-acyltransferase (sialic acid O-acetyltransferase NeuD family)